MGGGFGGRGWWVGSGRPSAVKLSSSAQASHQYDQEPRQVPFFFGGVRGIPTRGVRTLRARRGPPAYPQQEGLAHAVFIHTEGRGRVFFTLTPSERWAAALLVFPTVVPVHWAGAEFPLLSCSVVGVPPSEGSLGKGLCVGQCPLIRRLAVPNSNFHIFFKNEYSFSQTSVDFSLGTGRDKIRRNSTFCL